MKSKIKIEKRKEIKVTGHERVIRKKIGRKIKQERDHLNLQPTARHTKFTWTSILFQSTWL